MNQPYFIITLIAALTLGVLSINAGITFAQEKNETSEINDSPLITTFNYNVRNRWIHGNK